jgi:hypothetical protein
MKTSVPYKPQACTHQMHDNVHIGAATYENSSAISNAMSSTLDEKEKWSPTPCEKVPTPGEGKNTDPHTR